MNLHRTQKWNRVLPGRVINAGRDIHINLWLLVRILTRRVIGRQFHWPVPFHLFCGFAYRLRRISDSLRSSSPWRMLPAVSGKILHLTGLPSQADTTYRDRQSPLEKIRDTENRKTAILGCWHYSEPKSPCIPLRNHAHCIPLLHSVLSEHLYLP